MPIKKINRCGLDGTSRMPESVGSTDLSIDKNLISDSDEFLNSSRGEYSIYCRPLSFENFFQKCNDKLNQVFVFQFKKDKIFNDLLLEICKTEI